MDPGPGRPLSEPRVARVRRPVATGAPLLTPGFLTVLAVQSAFGYAFSTFMLLPKYLATELAVGAAGIGQVTALYGAAAMLCAPITGAWIDRGARLGFLRAGILLMVLGAAGFLWVDSMGPLVYALRLAQAIAWGLAFTAAAALVTDQAPPERMGQAIGLFGVSMMSMNAIAPAVAEEVAARAGWAPVFGLAAAACAASFALSWLLRESREPPRDGEHVPRLLDVLLRARSARVGLVVALTGAAFGAMVTFSQPFALELGMRNVRSFFVSYVGVAMAVRVGLGGLADRVGRARVSMVALALYAASVLWMGALEPGRLAWIGCLFGLAHGLFMPAFNALAVEGAGEHERGKIMALYNAAFNAGWASGGLALGFLAEHEGYPPVFAAASAGVGVALLVLLASRRAMMSA